MTMGKPRQKGHALRDLSYSTARSFSAEKTSEATTPKRKPLCRKRRLVKFFPESTDKRSEMQWRPMKSASPDPCPFTPQVKEGVGKPNSMFRGPSPEPTIDGGWKDPEFGCSVSC